MVSIYKTDENMILHKTDNIEHGCWINAISPSPDEIQFLANTTGIPIQFLRAPLDDEETSRIDHEDETSLVIVDIPFPEAEDNSVTYNTYPLAIIHTEKIILTICLKDTMVIKDFTEGKIKSFYTFKRSRFILQLLNRIATYYLLYLRQIDKKSLLIEKKLHKSMKNKELIEMLSLEKSLVYFSTSLKSNEITLEKMMKMDIMRKYPEDNDVLEDVIIENKQAIEMANIYSDILAGTMDAFASVIANNLNIVMKVLASVTIVMSIPNMISGVFGMNVTGIPFSTSGNGFFIILTVIITICITATIFLERMDMF